MELSFLIFVKFFATVTGIIMSFGYYSQAYKIYKKKSAKDVSLLSYIIFSFGTLVWLLYGIIIRDLTIILGFSLGVIGSWLVLFLLIIKRNKK
jgi:MtN3 and saliva related transmembrane protein